MLTALIENMSDKRSQNTHCQPLETKQSLERQVYRAFLNLTLTLCRARVKKTSGLKNFALLLQFHILTEPWPNSFLMPIHNRRNQPWQQVLASQRQSRSGMGHDFAVLGKNLATVQWYSRDLPVFSDNLQWRWWGLEWEPGWQIMIFLSKEFYC